MSEPRRRRTILVVALIAALCVAGAGATVVVRAVGDAQRLDSARSAYRTADAHLKQADVAVTRNQAALSAAEGRGKDILAGVAQSGLGGSGVAADFSGATGLSGLSSQAGALTAELATVTRVGSQSAAVSSVGSSTDPSLKLSSASLARVTSATTIVRAAAAKAQREAGELRARTSALERPLHALEATLLGVSRTAPESAQWLTSITPGAAQTAVTALSAAASALSAQKSVDSAWFAALSGYFGAIRELDASAATWQGQSRALYG